MSVSLTQALSIALSGLQTNQAQMAVASKNISNAQTPGYTAKTADLASVDYAASFGGVKVTGYERATNTALTINYNLATSSASYSSTQNTYMQQVQTILNSTSSNPTLSVDVANFASAWNQYAAQPESSIQSENVLSSAQTLVNDIHVTATQIGTLKSTVQGNITDSLTTLNSYIQQIADVNKSIQIASTSGQPVGDFQDQLDTLVNQVSTIVHVTTQQRQNSQIAVYTPDGQLLVDGQSAQIFSYSGGHITDTNGANVTTSMSGGSLQAALDFVDTSTSAAASATPGVGTIAKLQAQLSKLVDAFTNSSGGTPSPFATAFTAAVTASTAVGASQAGATVASAFFTVTNGGNGQPDPSTLAVTASLIANSSRLPQTSAQGIADSFNSVANYTSSGLSAQSVTYTGLTTAILSTFQQTANTIQAQSTTATSQQTYYKTTLNNSVGVNIDSELASLVQFQNSYAASAHIISTINQMLSTLMGMIQ